MNCQIDSERLWLTPFAEKDADAAFPAMTPSLTRYMAFDLPESQSDFEKVWREWLITGEEGADYAFTIRSKHDGRFIGLAGLHDAREVRPELGIWISESEHGHGYGFEAVQAVARWCSSKGSPTAFRYPVAELNQSSRRIAKRLGGTVVAFEVTPKYKSVIYEIPPVVDPGLMKARRFSS
ncbi:TPA: GNAT family N-acetyltransferase [Stenotrophomonas maltophilia]|nr:GNAT family N-acetyltransferase [Stenotrophomonas maltophilia]